MGDQQPRQGGVEIVLRVASSRTAGTDHAIHARDDEEEWVDVERGVMKSPIEEEGAREIHRIYQRQCH
jgi:hypothetical protein